MRASLPRALLLLAIGAAGCLVSVFVSTKVAPHHRENPRQITALAETIGRPRRQLRLQAFRDPKTVRLRPVVANGVPRDNATKGAPATAMGARIPPTIISSKKPPPSIDNGNAVVVGDATAGAVAAAVPPYNIDNALNAAKGFRYTLFFFVYDHRSDTFVIVHNIPGCDHGCARVYRCASVVAATLRKHFPERFTPDGKDFVVLLSTGDAPRIDVKCLANRHHCGSAAYAPLLQFGSVFVDPAVLPSAIAMPLPVRPHIACFDDWQRALGREGVLSYVCQDLQPKADLQDGRVQSGLVFGDQLGLTDHPDYWDQLVPQIIWRGTDFHFLTTMFQGMRAPEYKYDIAPKLSSFPADGSTEEGKQWAINALWQMGDTHLLPRWRGVLLTSEAELEAKKYLDMTGEPKLPWANIKFASAMVNGKKIPATEHAEYMRLQDLGITVIGEYVSLVEQASFKYHIDLGGGGGTTWTGTIQKLALPGVLFHHVTPTKDYFHDLLVPWEHYIPVAADLSDLRKKYAWAEEHPVEARQIAEQATQFVRWMGSPEGFARLYEDFLVAPLRRVLAAYRPPPRRHGRKSALDIIEGFRNATGAGFEVIGRCGGRHSNSCTKRV